MSDITTNSSENQLRTFLQEWWALITTISTSLAGLLTGLVSDGVAKFIGFILSLLMIGAAIYIWLKQEKKKKTKKEKEDRVQGYKTANESSSFRGLYSFKENDFLPGSDRQRQAKLIYTLISDRNFSFGLICGESGCGKSSILNAGVVKQLKSMGKEVILIEKDKSILKEELKIYLEKIRQSLFVQNNQGSSFLIVDQFEEFLITWLDTKERQSIGRFFYELSKSNVKVLLVLRKDFLADINDFEPDFPNPLSSKNIFYIKNFTTIEAKEIIEVCARRDGLSPTDEFIEVLVQDLTNDGYIRPVHLQIVCTALLTSFDLNSYRISGGVKGILSSYVKDSINLCSNPEVAKKILRSLCDFSSKAKSEPKTISNLKGEIGDSIDESTIENSLTQLETSRVITIIHENDTKKIKILHDYLVESIDIATSSIATSQERANQLVKYYVQNFQDDHKVSINSKDISFIKTNANRILLDDPRLKKLFRSNRIRSIYRVASYLLTIAIITTVLVATLTQKNYWKDEILGYHLGENNIPISTTVYPNPKQKHVLTGTFWGKPYAYLWDIETGKNLYTMKSDVYNWLNADLILSWDNSDSSTYLHDLLKKEKIKIPITYFKYNVLGSDENGNLIAFETPSSDSIILWSVSERKEVANFSCTIGSGSQALKFDPSLTRVFIACKKKKTDNANNAVGVWDIENGNFVKFLTSSDSSKVVHFIISKKTNKIFTIESTKNKGTKLVSWDMLLNKIKEVPIDKNNWLELSKDEKYLWARNFYSSRFELSNEPPEIFNTTNLLIHKEIAGAKQNVIIENHIIFNKQDSSKTYLLNIDSDYLNEINCNILNMVQQPIIHGDSLLIFLDSNKLVQLWDYKKQSKIILENIPDIMSLSLTLDRKMLQINQGGNKVTIVDISTNKIVANLTSIGSDNYYIYYNSNCGYFVVWTGDGRVLRYIKTKTILGKDFLSINCKN